MKIYEVEIEGQTHKVFAEKLAGTLWYHYQGETFSFAPQSKSRGGSGGGGLVHRNVQAPMPGKIIKVMVKVGEQVTAGQALLVMEAMKMEYTLEAQVDGPVERVSCQPGDQVSLGQELVLVGETE